MHDSNFEEENDELEYWEEDIDEDLSPEEELDLENNYYFQEDEDENEDEII